MDVRTNVLASLLVGCVTLSPGCALIFRGSQQEIGVAVSDPEATLTIDGQPATPGRIALDRGASHLLTAEIPGRAFASATIEPKINAGYLLLNIGLAIPTFGVWLIGLVVDLATGSIYDLEPGSVALDPQPKTTAAAGYRR